MESCEQAIQKRSLQPKKLKWMMMFKVRFEVSRLVPHARVQELLPPTGKPHLEDVTKKLAKNQEQLPERDFTFSGAHQHDLTRFTKGKVGATWQSARIASPDRRAAPRICEEKTREEPRAASRTRLHLYWCSPARLDEGHQGQG